MTLWEWNKLEINFKVHILRHNMCETKIVEKMQWFIILCMSHVHGNERFIMTTKVARNRRRKPLRNSQSAGESFMKLETLKVMTEHYLSIRLYNWILIIPGVLVGSYEKGLVFEWPHQIKIANELWTSISS